MSPAEMEMLIVFLAFLASGTFGLIGLRMFLTHRARRFAAGQKDDPQLADTVDEMRRELTAVRGEMVELHERIDFAERLLTRARDEGGPGSER